MLFAPLHPGAGGQRWLAYHAPAQGAPLGLVLHVHAFAEEMNKSRRMVSRQARLLAEAGYAVLLLDLLGCGDSDGDFGDATWPAWIDDVVAAAAWLRRRHAGLPKPALKPAAPPPLWLWGHRAGCLLAAEAARRMPDVAGLLLWQPVLNGAQQLQQFLRLGRVGGLLDGQRKVAAGAAGLADPLRAALAAGQPVELAGYVLSPALADGLAQALLAPPVTPEVPQAARSPRPAGQALWFEVSPRAEGEASAAQQAGAARWRDAGWQIDLQRLVGPAFWQTTEIEDADALLPATLQAMLRRSNLASAAAPA